MQNIEFLGTQWNPLILWWCITLITSALLGLAAVMLGLPAYLNPNQREAKKQKKAKGTLNGGLTTSEAESALLALARSLPVVCAGVFTFAIPALNSSVFWTAVAVSIAYGFFRECWIRASEVDWRAVYPSSRLAVAGRIIPNAMSFFCSYITVTLAIWLVSVL